MPGCRWVNYDYEVVCLISEIKQKCKTILLLELGRPRWSCSSFPVYLSSHLTSTHPFLVLETNLLLVRGQTLTIWLGFLLRLIGLTTVFYLMQLKLIMTNLSSVWCLAWIGQAVEQNRTFIVWKLVQPTH